MDEKTTTTMYCKVVDSEGFVVTILQANEPWSIEQWDELEKQATHAWNNVIQLENESKSDALRQFEKDALNFGGFPEFLKHWAPIEYPKEITLFNGIVCHEIRDN